MDKGIKGLPSWTLCVLLSPLFCSDSLFSFSTQGPLIESWACSLTEALPDVAATSSGEEEEIHYASLSFREAEPWKPQVQEGTSVEYSEVKIHK